jgi:uncharacterized protein (DUF2267 family)
MAELAFIDKAAERAEVPEDTARLLTEGTLLTLAARISGGEAEDLAERVPDQLRPYLIKLTEPAVPFSSARRHAAARVEGAMFPRRSTGGLGGYPMGSRF